MTVLLNCINYCVWHRCFYFLLLFINVPFVYCVHHIMHKYALQLHVSIFLLSFGSGSDAILLGAETLRGLYPVETISIVGKICAEVNFYFTSNNILISLIVLTMIYFALIVLKMLYETDCWVWNYIVIFSINCSLFSNLTLWNDKCKLIFQLLHAGRESL